MPSLANATSDQINGDEMGGPRAQTVLIGTAYTIIVRNCEEEKMDWKAQGWIGEQYCTE
jgi:hypothetical protein